MSTALRGKRRWYAAIAVTVAATIAVSACSGSSTSESSSAEVSVAPSSAAPAPSETMAVSASAEATGASLPQEIIDAGTLKVATSLYAPVDYYDTDGTTLIGFDADLVNEIGKRLGVAIEWNVVDFANVLPGIESKQYDFATDLNDTAEREAVVDFVTYFRDGTSIMVPQDNPNSIVDLSSLCGLKIVVTKGSTQGALVDTESTTCTDGGKDAINKLEVPDDPDAIQAMRSGRADAYLVNTLAGSYATTSGELKGFTVIPGVYDPVFVGMIFPKESTQLRDVIQSTLQSMIDDGFYLQIMEKYGVANNAIETVEINAAS